MIKVEQLKQSVIRSCDFCVKEDKNYKVIGGNYCVKLSSIPGNREKFSIDRFASNGHTEFWSCQVQGEIEDCPRFRGCREILELFGIY